MANGTALTHYRVLARGQLLVPDFGRMRHTGRFCLVGRTVHTAPTVDALPAAAQCAPIRERHDSQWTGDEHFVEAWVANREPSLVSAIGDEGAYYRERIAEGGLWPADQATADACGVPFDPTFAGEYADKSSKLSAKGA